VFTNKTHKTKQVQIEEFTYQTKNKTSSSFAASCLRNLVLGSAFIILRLFKFVGIIQQ